MTLVHEKLGEILNQNPNGVLLHRDELVSWLRGLDKEGREEARGFFLTAWNGTGGYTFDRIGRGTVHVEAMCVSILGGIQPGPLADYVWQAAHDGAGNDGLLQRFQLLVWPDDPHTWRNVDRWPDTEAKNVAFGVFERLADLDVAALGADASDGIPFLRFSHEAQAMFDEWRAELETQKLRSGEPEVIEAHLSKYRSLAPSLALLFHLIDDGMRTRDSPRPPPAPSTGASFWRRTRGGSMAPPPTPGSIRRTRWRTRSGRAACPLSSPRAMSTATSGRGSTRTAPRPP